MAESCRETAVNDWIRWNFRETEEEVMYIDTINRLIVKLYLHIAHRWQYEFRQLHDACYGILCAV